MRLRRFSLVGLVLLGALVWLRGSLDHEASPSVESLQPPAHPSASASPPAPPVASPPAPPVASPPALPVASPLAPTTSTNTRPARSGSGIPFDASSHHSADPCSLPEEPVIPAEYEQVTTAGITVAWAPKPPTSPYDVPLRPLPLAHTVVGVLEEAARFTGTVPRRQLTVIVHASAVEMRTRMRAPSWVGGLYDGGAIHLYADSFSDLGVAMPALRHELMHAQMHVSIGCTPFWFDEGIASYFAGEVRLREWIAMLQTPEAFDLENLRYPVLRGLDEREVRRRYTVSLAMVVYLVDRVGDVGIRHAVRLAQAADTRDTARALWSYVAPDVTYQDLLDDLAGRVFGVVPSSELDAILRGTICCRNLKQPAALACRAAGAERAAVERCAPRW